jgi:enoyl-CoA hydratase/carnithine racemase
MLEAARKLAGTIANNSSIAVQGTKIALNYAEDHPTEDGNYLYLLYIQCLYCF